MNPNYYIVFMIFCSIIMSCLYGLNHNECFPNTSIDDEDFSKHYLLHRTFNSIGIVVISIFLLIYEKKVSKSESKEENKNKTKNILIYNNNENEFNSKRLFLLYLLLIICWVLIDDIIENYIVIFQDLDFWMFELIFLWFLNIKMFKNELYKHHILAISLCILSSLLKIGTIIVTFTNIQETKKEEKNYNGGLPIFYKTYPYTIPLGLILYILIIFLRSYISLKLKWFMDKKYVSHIKLFGLYGAFGIIIYFFLSLIGTFQECPNDDDENSKYLYLCKVNYPDNNTIYIENFKKYSDNYGNNETKIWREIITVILGFFIFSFKKYFSILIIKYLTPVHVIISIPIVFFLQKVVMVTHLLESHGNFCNSSLKKKIKFFLDIFGDCFSILGFLIYLEIIVLKCFKWDYNIKDNIMRRSVVEINDNDNEDETEIILNESDIKEFQIEE